MSVFVSIIVPTFNGASRIGNCLESLQEQAAGLNVEILVVDDGSTDDIADIVAQFSGVRLIKQPNAGPAAARNRGAVEASGKLLIFTDDDCVPMKGWLAAMIAPFEDEAVVAAKGIYRTHQSEIVARFVQVEYEDRYRIMAAIPDIDFIDTYSAAFIRERFMEMDGYDTSFPVACAEDAELSYRMSRRGWKMKFQPAAVVYHTHPNTLPNYLKKKYKFAFWRVLAVRKNPEKGLKDSHTPQIMKLQLLFAPALLCAIILDLFEWPRSPFAALVVIALFCISALPFTYRAIPKDPAIALLSPAILAARACAQFLGVAGGLIYTQRNFGTERARARRLKRAG